MEAPIRSKKSSRWNIPAQPNYDKEIEVAASRNSQLNLLAYEKNVPSVNKSKSSGTKLMLPPTSMAAHAVDEDVEIELDTIQVTATASRRVDKRATHDIKSFPVALPTLPPIMKNDFSLYEDNDENIDVDGVEDETTDVNII